MFPSFYRIWMGEPDRDLVGCFLMQVNDMLFMTLLPHDLCCALNPPFWEVL